MLSRSLIILAVVGFCCAATWQGYLPQKPKELAHKEGCYVSEINDVVPFGSEITPLGQCYRINCERGMMYYASCGVVSTSDPNCFLTAEDLTKPYPSCCPDIECIENNTI